MTTTSSDTKQDYTVTPHRQVLTPTRVSDTTREEIGFAEFPIVTAAVKRPPFNTLEFVEQVGLVKGKPIYRTWKMVGSEEYGLPRLPDLDVFIAILRLAERHQYRKRVIMTTAKELCDIAGITPGGETYTRLKLGLNRFTTTSYVSDRVFKHPKSKQPILGEAWSIVAEFRLLPDIQDPAVADGLPPSYIMLGEKFLNRLRNGQLKSVDLALWRKLPSTLAKPLYHYLDKNLYKKTRFEIGTRKLAERIAITGKYNPSQRRRLFEVHAQTLVKHGVLDRFKFEPATSTSTSDPEKIVIFPGPHTLAKSTRKIVVEKSSTGTTPTEAMSKPSKGVSDEPAFEILNYYAQVLPGASVTGRANERLARKLLDRCSGDIEKAKQVIVHFRREAALTNWENIHSFAALFSHEEKYIDKALNHEHHERRTDEAHAKQMREEKLLNEYHLHIAAELDQWEKDYPKDYAERLKGAKKAALSSQDRRFRRWTDDTLTSFARHRVRAQLHRELPLPKFDSFKAKKVNP